jgi:hypothetical protein
VTVPPEVAAGPGPVAAKAGAVVVLSVRVPAKVTVVPALP